MTAEQGNGLVRRMDFYFAMVSGGDFSRAALRVAFVLLYRHLNGTTGRCDPARATLAAETHQSERAVQYAIAELEQSGWWIVERNEGTAGRGGRPNTYRPNPERGAKPFTPSMAEGEQNRSPLSAERGAKPFAKGEQNRSPKPVKNQEEDSYTSDRSATRPVCEGSPFDDFWRAYPSRSPHDNPRKPAKAKFEAALKRGADPAAIIRGARNYARYVTTHVAERQHVAMALTWLGQERWTDHQEPPAEEPPRRRVGSW